MSYKATADQLRRYLKDLTGLSVEVVEDYYETNFDEKSMYDAVDKNRMAILRPKIEEEVRSEVSGIFGNRLRKALKKHCGLSGKSLEEIKDDEEVIAAAFKSFEEKWSGDAQEVNKKLESIVSQKDKEIEDIRNQYERQVQEWEGKFKGRDIVNHIKQQLNKVKVPEGADRDYLAQQMYNQYKSKFDIDLTQDESTGKSVVTVMQKGTKYAALNKDGKNVFDWEEAVVDFLKPIYGASINDNRTDNPLVKMHETTNPAFKTTSGQGKQVTGTDVALNAGEHKPRSAVDMAAMVIAKAAEKAGGATA